VLRDYAAALTQPTLPLETGEEGGGERPARYDEVVAPDGTLRPGWKSMAAAAFALTPEEVRRAEWEIARLLAEDGVTYVARSGGAQPWRLDPVPLVIDAPSWARLEVGLVQRAELLNAVLVDLYGERSLLSSGIVPPAAVFGHSGFIRAVAGRGVPDAQPLLLSATDLGRDDAGEWRVLADRVQAPSGLGFASENRRVLSRALPDLYQESGLHRVDAYFSALRSALLEADTNGAADPRVVVLSPGIHSETAFDQAFLASTLGFPLVQGDDLTVLDGSVWMKPSGWPRTTPTERVDVILRRVDADWCDPLELRADSRLGVAGLAEVARRGRVRIVNGLGAGVLENPALLPFLPAISEHLLGEQLRLESLPTWWAGEPAGLAAVLDGLSRGRDDFVVRTIDEPRSVLADLDTAELRARILAAPHRFVGQERLLLSQTPVWHPDGRADAYPVMLRSFTLRYGAAFRPLLGGLATVQRPGQDAPTTKDVWVLKATPSDADQGLVDVVPLATNRSVPTLGPRALEDMFWAGRYAERAEDMLRLVLTASERAGSTAVPLGSDRGASALAVRHAVNQLTGSRYLNLDADLASVLLDPDRSGSVAQALSLLRNALEGVRDQLSVDTWRVFANTDRAAGELRASLHAPLIDAAGGQMLTAVLSLHGVTSSMIRDAGWQMIETGRFLERTLQVCLLLQSTVTVRLDPSPEREVLEAVLACSESSVTFRRRYRGNVKTAGALELLLVDGENPRSLAFAIDRLRGHLAAMPASTGSTRPERLLEQVESSLHGVDLVELSASRAGKRPALSGFLANMSDQLQSLADSIADVHFASGPEQRALSSLTLTEVMG
jgi:uncharacterized circularly permuted ATP-grasp superfamily protein/uncharacterized alpha-E superfamily protein